MLRIPRYYFKIKYNFCIYNKNDIKIFKQLGVVNVLYAFIVYLEQIFIKLYQTPLGIMCNYRISYPDIKKPISNIGVFDIGFFYIVAVIYKHYCQCR